MCTMILLAGPGPDTDGAAVTPGVQVSGGVERFRYFLATELENETPASRPESTGLGFHDRG